MANLSILVMGPIGMLATCSALAETAPAGSPGKSASQPDSPSEIVVTATRRASAVRDVPIAISAFSQADLDRKSIRAVDDLARVTPGVTFTPGWGGSTAISIRGISSAVGAGTTGVYLDDTPIQVRALGAGDTSTNAYPQIFDLDHVEVLRGPQGTLFGAGSEGGTVRFITPQPSLTSFGGYARSELAFTQGGDPTAEAGFAWGGPLINDRLGFRISAYDRRDGGWVDRADPQTNAPVDKNSNHVQTIALRAALKFAPSADISITPSVFFQRQRRHDTDQVWRSLSDPDNGVFHNGQPLRQPSADRYVLAALATSWNIRFADLISNTSYFRRRNPNLLDYTAYIPELLGVDYRAGFLTSALAPADMSNRQSAFTQEIRAQSHATSKLKWVVGAFYQSSVQHADEAVHISNGDAFSNAVFGADLQDVFGIPLAQPGDLIYYGFDRARDQQLAGFAQIDWSATKTLTFTAGLRGAHTRFRSSNVQGGPFNGAVTSGTAEESEHPITPKFGIEYKPDRDLMLYASAAKGYRPGGGNSPVPAASCAVDLGALGLTNAPTSYGSDGVWSYEVGAKGRLGAIRAEASAFNINWKNIQNSVPLNNCGFAYVANLGSAHSRGADLHLVATPFTGLNLEAALGYTDAHFDKTIFGGATLEGTRAIVVSKGEPLPVAPWTVSLSADYSFTLDPRSGSIGYIHTEYRYSSGFSYGRDLTASFDPYDNRQNATHIARLRVGLRKGRIDASLFLDNIFNSADRLNVFHDTVSSSLIRDVVLRPRTMGVTVSYRY